MEDMNNNNTLTTHEDHARQLFPNIDARRAELHFLLEGMEGALECELDLFGGRTVMARNLRQSIINLKQELEGIEQLLTPDTVEL